MKVHSISDSAALPRGWAWAPEEPAARPGRRTIIRIADGATVLVSEAPGAPPIAELGGHLHDEANRRRVPLAALGVDGATRTERYAVGQRLLFLTDDSRWWSCVVRRDDGFIILVETLDDTPERLLMSPGRVAVERYRQ